MNFNKLKHKIEKHYECHNVQLKLIIDEEIKDGARIIYSIKPCKGTKESMIFNRASDIQTALKLPLFQPFKEGLFLYIAVSAEPVTENSLWSMLIDSSFRKSDMWIPIALGYDMRGVKRYFDLGRMPHALYAGATSSGKSVGLQCVTSSIICLQSVNQVNLVLFDVGANTMDMFEKVPHLSHPIIKDTDTGIYVIRALNDEMERRISLERDVLKTLPAVVCIIDEYVSFISNIGDRKLSQLLAKSISNLLRRGRHAKIHIVLATQDPTQKNMKVELGNITARIAFACAKPHNSVTILGEGGAEKLQGKGAMLYKSNECPEPIPLQGAFMSSDEIKKLVNHISSKPHQSSKKFIIPEFDISKNDILSVVESDNNAHVKKRAEEIAKIILWTLGRNKVSVHQIQQHFKIGNRASDIIDKLNNLDIVADKFANQPRDVLPQSIDDIPDDVRSFLATNGVDEDTIIKTIKSRDSDAGLL